MFKNLPFLNNQPNNKDTLWRYLDLAKFLSLIENEELFFCSLGLFNDVYEGHVTRPMLEKLNIISKGLPNDVKQGLELAYKKDGGLFRASMCASCWYNNSVETDAMWKLYNKGNEGIAIKTTFDRLKKSFDKTEIEVFGAMVNYVDFDTYYDDPHPFNVALLKRLNFQTEKEFRAILWNQTIGQLGMAVPVDIKVLIDDVYVSPYADEWFFHLVRKLVSRYELDIKVTHSVLNQPPNYL